MSGPFAPVEGEAYEAEMEVVEGAVPPDLVGAFVRTGGRM